MSWVERERVANFQTMTTRTPLETPGPSPSLDPTRFVLRRRVDNSILPPPTKTKIDSPTNGRDGVREMHAPVPPPLTVARKIWPPRVNIPREFLPKKLTTADFAGSLPPTLEIFAAAVAKRDGWVM